ncbi:MAG: hypothetical protein ABI679_05365 [Gemmatimonadota bacterium]
MRNRWMVLAALAAGSAAAPLLAQRTADQARLSLGLAAGATAGTSLWSISGQPIFDGASLNDTMLISRRLRGSLAVVFHGTYFPGENWGVTGEAMLLGLGTEDDCRLTFASGSSRNSQVCNSIRGHSSPASAVSLSAGVLYRVWSRHVFSPYARVNGGLVVSQHSSIQTDGFFQSPSEVEPTRATVFDDPTRARVVPVVGVGMGFTAAVGHGYQLRWELRDNITGVEKVTGPTSGAPNLEPPHKLSYRHIVSVTFGFDVVLERRRGRRY